MSKSDRPKFIREEAEDLTTPGGEDIVEATSAEEVGEGLSKRIDKVSDLQNDILQRLDETTGQDDGLGEGEEAANKDLDDEAVEHDPIPDPSGTNPNTGVAGQPCMALTLDDTLMPWWDWIRWKTPTS